MNPELKILITGAAGLVGQNLVVELKQQGYRNLVAMDKHAHNLAILRELHPDVTALTADLAEPGDWEAHFADAEILFLLQARITGLDWALFEHDTLESTRRVLEAARRYHLPYCVHVSSSVVNSVADDLYTRSKIRQEEMVRESGLTHCVLRPTLMFGWFDPKHLGWLSRFMSRVPVFPIPGHGRYPRQPLYNRDFCRMLIQCMKNRPDGEVYDVVGDRYVDYVDIIHAIKQARQLRVPIVHLPLGLFKALMRGYALFSKHPPFTVAQLEALTAGDRFEGVDTEAVFGVRQTPFEQAIRETFCDPRYSRVVLRRA